MKQWFQTAVFSLGLFVLTACAGLTPTEDVDYLALQNQLDEAGRKIEVLQHRMSVMQFMLDKHQQSLGELEKLKIKNQVEAKPIQPLIEQPPVREADLPPAAAGTPPVTKQPPVAVSVTQPRKSAKQLYDEALSAFRGQKYDLALSLFQNFLNTYTNHAFSDNALYWSGECLYSQKKFTEALPVFKKVVDIYPKGGKAPDALLKIGYVHLNLKHPSQAKTYFKNVIKRYPFSPAAEKAEHRLKLMKD